MPSTDTRQAANPNGIAQQVHVQTRSKEETRWAEHKVRVAGPGQREIGAASPAVARWTRPPPNVALGSNSEVDPGRCVTVARHPPPVSRTQASPTAVVKGDPPKGVVTHPQPFVVVRHSPAPAGLVGHEPSPDHRDSRHPHAPISLVDSPPAVGTEFRLKLSQGSALLRDIGLFVGLGIEVRSRWRRRCSGLLRLPLAFLGLRLLRPGPGRQQHQCGQEYEQTFHEGDHALRLSISQLQPAQPPS